MKSITDFYLSNKLPYTEEINLERKWVENSYLGHC